MTYTDKDLTLIASGTDVKTGPFYSSSIDLTVSPDIGTGEQLVALIVVETFTDSGSGTGCHFEIVSSEASNLQTTPRVLGSSGDILSADLELCDDAGRPGAYQPIVVRINPNHWGALAVSGVADRYIGLRIVHDGADPTALTVHAQFTLNWTSSPAISHHASGMTIA